MPERVAVTRAGAKGDIARTIKKITEMKKMRRFTVKVEKADEPSQYVYVIARSIAAAINWVVKNCEGVKEENIAYINIEDINIAEEEPSNE